ncbi:MAG: hypothetical protein CMP10_00685 [Zetaproteobacteria bacterium]|nr:hypothetical protein [Pseudobdellovibrionaceae bacterium]
MRHIQSFRIIEILDQVSFDKDDEGNYNYKVRLKNIDKGSEELCTVSLCPKYVDSIKTNLTI